MGIVGYGKPPIEHQIKPGEVRNPGGRPKNAGLSIIEAHNAMAAMSFEEIEAIAKDKSAPMAKRAAATRWLSTIDVGKDGREELAEICDRTHGKAQQSMDVTTGGNPVKSYQIVTPDDWDKPDPKTS